MQGEALMPDRFMRTPEVMAAIGLGRTTIYYMEKAGRFPARRLIGPGTTGWLESEILEWMRSRPATPGQKPAVALAALKARRAAAAATSDPATA